MIDNRNINIITDDNGKKLVLINNIRFKGKRQIAWDDVKQYLEGFIGDYYEIAENAEHIFIGSELPEEYTESESRKSLMGANAKAKANAAIGIFNAMGELCSPLTTSQHKAQTSERGCPYLILNFPSFTSSVHFPPFFSLPNSSRSASRGFTSPAITRSISLAPYSLVIPAFLT